MKNPKTVLSIALALSLATFMSGCSGVQKQTGGENTQSAEGSSQFQADTSDLDLTFSKRDTDPSFDETGATKITLLENTATVEGSGAATSNSTVTLSEAKTYIVQGELTDGEIIVDAGDEDKLQIVFCGVSIHNEDGPALLIKNADKCFVTLADGTSNTLSDGTEYVLQGEDANYDATLFSKDDLTINGSGSLNVSGNYKHAIVSKDDLVIAGGNITATAESDTFQGKDAIKITGANIEAQAGDDAFHSEYLLYIKDGNITVTDCYEGYEAEKVIVDGGSHYIYATDDAINAAVADDEDTEDSEGLDAANLAGEGKGDGIGNPPEGAFGEGMPDRKAFEDSGTDGKKSTEGSGKDMQGMQEFRGTGAGGDEMKDASPFAPEESAENPSDGDFSKGDFQGKDSESGDFPNGGFPMRGTDDASAEPPDMRFSEGADGPQMQNGGSPMASTSQECLIQINGGTFNITGLTDCFDSNGNIEINGGEILACGPSQGMDGVFTFDLYAHINGGNLLMLGSVDSTRGMDESEQCWAIEKVSGKQGNTVALISKTGETIASVDATMDFTEVFVSSPQIESGQDYSIQIGSDVMTLTM